MKKRSRPLPTNPHDRYFEEVFKFLVVVQQLVRVFIPPEQLALLNLDALQLSSESFIGADQREFFSDLVYMCETTEGQPVRVCLLLEHKSTNVGRRIFVQLGNYLRGIQEEDIRQGRTYFTLTIPILFYHGEEPWEPGSLRHQYGPVPVLLTGYIPHFDLVYIQVSSLSDEVIEGMHDALLLRNVLLAFKHARDVEYLRQNFSKILIFVFENADMEVLLGLFEATFLYLQRVSTLQKEEVMNLIQTLPPAYEERAKTTYEQIFEEGLEKGREQGLLEGRMEGRMEGMEALLLAFLRKNPDWSDERVATTFEVSMEVVQKVRQMI
jgi:predicted transposase/invertase (TIGR01784 family)